MALTTLLSACGDVEVSLTTDAAEYQPGDTVQLLLRNQGLQEVGYNLCYVRLERQEGDGWAHTPHLGEDEVCPAIQYSLEAHAHADGTLRLPKELPAGEYRVVHDVDARQTDSEGRSVHVSVVSGTFFVGESE
jgi:hypothetical protein